jgi:thioredoxin 1
MAIRDLTASDFDGAVAQGRCVVDFWAAWCGPCRMQGPILEQLDARQGDQVQVCKVNVDEEGALAERFGVMSIPTLLFFRDGRQTGKAVGVQTMEALTAALGL